MGYLERHNPQLLLVDIISETLDYLALRIPYNPSPGSLNADPQLVRQQFPCRE